MPERRDVGPGGPQGRCGRAGVERCEGPDDPRFADGEGRQHQGAVRYRLVAGYPMGSARKSPRGGHCRYSRWGEWCNSNAESYLSRVPGTTAPAHLLTTSSNLAGADEHAWQYHGTGQLAGTLSTRGWNRR